MKYKLSKNIILPGTITALSLCLIFGEACSTDHSELIIFSALKDKLKGKKNIEQKANFSSQDIVSIKTDDNMAISFNNNGVIVNQQPSNNQTDYEVIELTAEDIEQEEVDDLISDYIVSLQEINEDNPLVGIDTEEFVLEHYDELFYDTKDFSKIKKQYAALAYQRLIDCDVDIMKAFDELHMIMLLQLEPTDMDEDEYEKTFSELKKTLKGHENVYDVYFPLAKQIHIVSCQDEHFIEADTGITYCDSLKEEIKENSYTK